MPDELTSLLIFCEGMRVNMEQSQSKTLDDLMNAAMADALGDALEIKKLRKMLSEVEEHGILSVLERFETRLAQSNERVEKLKQTVTKIEKKFEDVFSKMQEELENRLAAVYNLSVSDAATIGKLCDDRLDRSGAMLGRVRDIAAALERIEREEAEGRK